MAKVVKKSKGKIIEESTVGSNQSIDDGIQITDPAIAQQIQILNARKLQLTSQHNSAIENIDKQILQLRSKQIEQTNRLSNKATKEATDQQESGSDS